MRHRKKINHLGRKSAHRHKTLSSLATSLILHKRIHTTVAKAKALRIFVEPLITKSKVDSTHSRRTVFGYLRSKHAVSELFREVAQKVADRPGGYTRILKTGFRKGDSAEMCFIELVDYNANMLVTEEQARQKTTRRAGRRRKAASEKTEEAAAAAAPTAEKATQGADDQPEVAADVQPDETVAKTSEEVQDDPVAAETEEDSTSAEAAVEEPKQEAVEPETPSEEKAAEKEEDKVVAEAEDKPAEKEEDKPAEKTDEQDADERKEEKK